MILYHHESHKKFVPASERASLQHFRVVASVLQFVPLGQLTDSSQLMANLAVPITHVLTMHSPVFEQSHTLYIESVSLIPTLRNVTKSKAVSA